MAKKETQEKSSQNKNNTTPIDSKTVASSSQNFLENFNWHNYEEGIDLI